MREINQRAREARTIYGCSYCKKVLVRAENMVKHELSCYRNPDRICKICGQQNGDGCVACSRAKEALAYIEVYEAPYKDLQYGVERDR